MEGDLTHLMLVDEQGDLVWLYRDELVVVWFSLKKRAVHHLNLQDYHLIINLKILAKMKTIHIVRFDVTPYFNKHPLPIKAP